MFIIKLLSQEKGYIQNNIKRQSEVEASKKTVKSRKELVLNNNTKMKLKSTVDHQDKGSIQSQVLKNIGEQNKKGKASNIYHRKLSSRINDISTSVLEEKNYFKVSSHTTYRKSQ